MVQHAMGKKRFDMALAEILTVLELMPAVLRYTDIRKLLANNRTVWNLPKSMTVGAFLAELVAKTPLRKVILSFPHSRQTRYVRGSPSVHLIAQSLNPTGYFSHFTAMSLQNLTTQIPKTIRLNVEQSPKKFLKGQLAQSRIDVAFTRPPRVSSNSAPCGDYVVQLLNGMHTGQLGVMAFPTNDGISIRCTDIERTLIDIAVRPFYSGGVFEVLGAYQAARPAVDIARLAQMLRELNYTYPYHQAIGFYLEKAGSYTEDELHILERFDMDFDFYLTHQIRKREYSPRWRLYYPLGM